MSEYLFYVIDIYQIIYKLLFFIVSNGEGQNPRL